MLKSKVSKAWSYSFYLKSCVLSMTFSLSCFSLLSLSWGAADSPVFTALPGGVGQSDSSATKMLGCLVTSRFQDVRHQLCVQNYPHGIIHILPLLRLLWGPLLLRHFPSLFFKIFWVKYTIYKQLWHHRFKNHYFKNSIPLNCLIDCFFFLCQLPPYTCKFPHSHQLF